MPLQTTVYLLENRQQTVVSGETEAALDPQQLAKEGSFVKGAPSATETVTEIKDTSEVTGGSAINSNA